MARFEFGMNSCRLVPPLLDFRAQIAAHHVRESAHAAALNAVLSLRVPGLDVVAPREVVMPRMAPYFAAAAESLVPGRGLVTAGQVHGREIAVVDDKFPVSVAGVASEIAAVDALITLRRDVVLGIVVADCCPVWLWSPNGRGVAVAHAGRKGAEAGIAARAAVVLAQVSDCGVTDLIAFLGPCIRPPHYEVDIPHILRRQLGEIGVHNVLDCGFDTAADDTRFYSYRMEKGHTGRMMAFGWVG